MIKKYLLVTLSIGLTLSFFSGNVKASVSNPIEISAAKSLQWDRKNKIYIANKNVIVKQGLMKIESDKLIAHYAEVNGITDILNLEASLNVVITSPPYVAYGDKATYDVKSGNAVLMGQKIVVLTGKDIMKADKKIEFFNSQNKLVATGNPIVNHAGDTIKAKTMTAYFKKDKSGKLQAEKIIAVGNVIIKTIKELVTGDRGVYNVLRQTAVLTGHVKINQGKNHLEGNKANVNLITGHSELLGDEKSKIKTRVKGVFYPASNDSNKSKEDKKEKEKSE